MRSLATLGGVIVLIVLAIAWKISNQVEAGLEPAENSGVVLLGVSPDESQADANGPAREASEGNSTTTNNELGAGSPATGDPADSLALSNSKDAEPKDPAAQSDGSPNSAGTNDDPPGPDPNTLAGDSAVIYIVQSNETMYGILMRAYGKASPDLIEAVAAANHMDDPSALNVGQSLRLPVVPGFPAPKKL
jgi:LysM domain-containing protein